ncbi:MAG: hypothetical protein LJE70_17605 [Chromatiaceae bacterium]|nr:hypothetical protein [Chromatiaceae bacterium]
MKLLSTIPLFLSLIPSHWVHAAEDARAQPLEDSRGTWDHAQQTAKEWWQRSREATEDAWSDTQKTVEKLWKDTRGTAESTWDSTRELLEPQDPDPFGEMWNRVLPKLDETLVLQERQEELPPSAWFGDDQASNQEAIDALLDESVSILSTSNLQHYREQIRSLQKQIAAARQEIAADRQRRVSAPQKSMVERTVDDLDRAIEARLFDIARYEDQLSQVRRAFAADLRQMGLELSDEQVELLLSTVVGDNLIDLGIVFDNVKTITAQLERLVQESGEDLQSARRYYGMYVILLKSLNQMHLQVEQAISAHYIPQIDAIIARAKALNAETRALQDRSPEKAELLAANFSAQQLTIEAGGVYREYLTDQGRQVADGRRELERDIAAAWNTYETVRVSGEFVGLVRSSRKLLDGLLDRQVPPLRPFHNLEMKREFEKLTAQLRRADET